MAPQLPSFSTRRRRHWQRKIRPGIPIDEFKKTLICRKDTSNSKMTNIQNPFLSLWGFCSSVPVYDCLWCNGFAMGQQGLADCGRPLTQRRRRIPVDAVGEWEMGQIWNFTKTSAWIWEVCWVYFWYTSGYLRITYILFRYMIDNCFYCYCWLFSSWHHPPGPRSRSVTTWASKCCRTPSMVSIFVAWRAGVSLCSHKLGMDQTFPKNKKWIMLCSDMFSNLTFCYPGVAHFYSTQHIGEGGDSLLLFLNVVDECAPIGCPIISFEGNQRCRPNIHFFRIVFPFLSVFPNLFTWKKPPQSNGFPTSPTIEFLEWLRAPRFLESYGNPDGSEAKTLQTISCWGILAYGQTGSGVSLGMWRSECPPGNWQELTGKQGNKQENYGKQGNYI